jgi:hypothetical protein
MVIHTKEDWEQARIAFEQRSPQALAAIILSLVDASNGIGTRIHVFAAADDPKAAAALLRQEIDCLIRGEREYDVRHRRGAEWVHRLDRALDAIETDLLPKDRRVAFDLLTSLIKNETAIGEHASTVRMMISVRPPHSNVRTSYSMSHPIANHRTVLIPRRVT